VVRGGSSGAAGWTLAEETFVRRVAGRVGRQYGMGSRRIMSKRRCASGTSVCLQGGGVAGQVREKACGGEGSGGAPCLHVHGMVQGEWWGLWYGGRYQGRGRLGGGMEGVCLGWGGVGKVAHIGTVAVEWRE